MFVFRVKRILRMGLMSLWRHKLRSLLTMLGIVFGVASVIAMLAIGEGASKEAQEQIKLLGSQNILLRSVKPPQDENVNTATAQIIDYGLTYLDAERIATTVPAVEVVVPVREIASDGSFLSRRRDVKLKGTVPWYLDVTKLSMQPGGRFFNTVDMRNRLPVCVIGAGLRQSLLRNYDPMGQFLKVGSDYYEIIGVLAERTTTPGQDPASDVANDVYIPLTTAQDRYGEVIARVRAGTIDRQRIELHQINVRVRKLEDVAPTAEVIRQLVKRFHKKLDFEVIVPLELLRQAERTKRIFNIVLGSIAAISLLVGGIGIMNIMLASVTERTREIGIRRALGAKRHDIIVQFLTETVLLSGWGGVIGLVLGLLIPQIVARFAKMPTVVTLWSLMLSLGISLAVGILFGLYPAYRAAQMDPIEALRHE